MKLLRTSSVARSATVLAVTGLTLAAPAWAADTERTAFDARPADEAAPPGKATRALKRALGDQGLVSADPYSGTVRAAAKLDGALTRPSGRDGEDVALDYVRGHARALGLDGGETPPGLERPRRLIDGRMQLITWTQAHRGIPSADTYLKAAIDDRGRLLSLTGAPAAELDPPAVEPGLTAAAAVAAVTGSAPRRPRTAAGAERTTTFRGGARASLVLYQGEGGTRLAWRVLAPVSRSEFADALVDAADGAVVKRANRVKFATPKVFPSNPDDSAQIPFPFPAGWGTQANRLKGTRVHAFTDAADVVTETAFTPDPAGEVGSDHWDDPLVAFAVSGCGGRCTWSGGTTWSTNAGQSATQLYYLVNTFLDHLADPPIGFTAAEGGFGADDPILAQALDGAATGDRNNASFLAYPDGDPGLLEVHLFSAPNLFLDGVNDASLVFHEVTHGLTERLVTDAQGFGALTLTQPAAIAEGTSDYYAMDYLVSEGLETDTPPRLGEYLGSWLRDEPIEGNALTYGPLSGEAHTDGEIWAQTLWQLRAALTPPVARGLITDALRLAPPEPSFLDMRNAILAASDDDTDDEVWDVFASRGMGYRAATDGPADDTPFFDYSDPADLGEPDATLEGTVLDEDGTPVEDAQVGIAGLDTAGLGPLQAAHTDGAGHYELTTYAGTHPVLRVRKAGHADAEVGNVTLPGLEDVVLPRDWASAARRATIESFTGADNSSFGCGPGGLIDDTSTTVWGTTHGRSIIVDLGVPVDVDALRIDPGAGCGDDDTAALRHAELQMGTGPGAYHLSSSTIPFPALPRGAFHEIQIPPTTAVRYVRLVARTPQSTEPGTSGENFVDISELQITKTPGSPLGPTVETGAATGVGPSGATLSGTVAANGEAAPVVVFEYGTTREYGTTVAASGATGTVRAAIAGLKGSTRYYWRVVALRDGRRYPGGQATFVTDPAPPPPPPPPPPAEKDLSVAISTAKAKADRKGRFSFRIRFGDDVEEGTASVTVKSKGKTIAKGRFAVEAGRTMTVRLKLTKSGRKVIKAGRKARKVNVTVRLPDGETFGKKIRLSRRR
jgi:hypothetical protein